MSNLLVPDKLTNGFLTGLLEKAFKQGGGHTLGLEEIKTIHELILRKSPDLFRPISSEYSVSKPKQDQSEERWSPDWISRRDYDFEAFILADYVYPAGGRIDFFRSKGQRLIWLKNGQILAVSNFSRMNFDEFFMYDVVLDEIDINKNEYTDIFGYVVEGARSGGDLWLWLSHLCRISAYGNTNRYPLEHLVEIPYFRLDSTFSQILRATLWESVIETIIQTGNKSLAFADLEPIIRYSLENLSAHKIFPPSRDMAALLLKAFSADKPNAEILTKLNLLLEAADFTNKNLDTLSTNVGQISQSFTEVLKNLSDMGRNIAKTYEKSDQILDSLIKQFIDDIHANIGQKGKTSYAAISAKNAERYARLELTAEELQIFSSAEWLSEQQDLHIDFSGQILLYLKFCENICNRLFRDKFILPIRKTKAYIGEADSIKNQKLSREDHNIMQWLETKNNIPLGQFAYFVKNLSRRDYAFSSLSSLFEDIDRKNHRNYLGRLRRVITPSRIQQVRNGFIHEHVAKIQDLSAAQILAKEVLDVWLEAGSNQ